MDNIAGNRAIVRPALVTLTTAEGVCTVEHEYSRTSPFRSGEYLYEIVRPSSRRRA